ncbi:MAG: zinc ribbon domain-containing protein [Flavobacteriales bacterium AspAUS03]
MVSKIQELTVEEKLRALYKLQLIDSRIDEIKNLRGGLPLEIQDLEDELKTLAQKIEDIQQEISKFEKEIEEKRVEIKAAEAFIKKYKVQQDKVRNNREFEALNKEIEYQSLGIELAQKRIKESFTRIDQKKTSLEELEEFYTGKEEHLSRKKDELEKIVLENQGGEKILMEKSEAFSKEIEPRLLQTYRRIRKGVKDGLAVVPVQRGASVGSYLFIPPQIHSELAQRKNFIIDEHSGRILIDATLAEEVEQEIRVEIKID